jgi:hypothetical protein
MGISLTEIKNGLTPSGRDLQLYTNVFVFLNGQLLTQETSVTLEKKSNAKTITTLHKGFAGLSKGAGLIELTVDNAVPLKDLEFNVDFFVKSGDVIEIGSVLGARQTICKGFITDVTYSHATNDNTKLSFKATCQLEVFE